MEKKSSVFDKPYGAMTEEERAREREKYKSEGEASYSFYDEQGNKIGSGRIDINTDPSTIKKVYKKSDGSYTNIEPEAKTGVYIDRVSGKITVEAPDYVINREGFKEQIGDTLKTLSRLYKTDKNYKVPQQDGSSKSVTKIIEELNDPNNDESIVAYVDAVNSMRKQEYGYREGDKKYDGDRNVYKIDDKTKLNDRYFSIRNTIALGDDLKDDTRQAVPKQLAEAAFLRALESYDESTGTVQYKDLMENGWNREKHSDEELLALNDSLESYFASGDYSDTDELAANIALYEFINGRDPDVAWYRNVGEHLGRLFQGAVWYAGDTIDYGSGAIFTGIENAITDINDFIYQRGETIAPGLLEKSFDQMTSDWETWKEEETKRMGILSDSQAAAVQIGYGVAKLATLIGIGNYLSGVAKGAAAAIGGAAKAADAANTASNVATALAAGGKLGEGALTTLGGLSTLQNMANGMSVIAKVASPQTLAGIANVLNAVTESKVASGIVGLVGETFGESITGNPQLFYKVVSTGDLTNEAKQQLWEDFTMNSAGLVGGVTIGKGLMKAGETVHGRAISHDASVLINKISTNIGEARAKIQAKIHGFDDIEDYIKQLNSAGRVKKADAIAIREMLRTAQKEVAESGYVSVIGSSDDILKQLDEVEEATFKLMNLNNAIDAMQSRGKSVAAEWYLSGKYREFEGANDTLESAYKTLKNVEDAANIKLLKRRVGKYAITQDTANYVEGMAKRDIIKQMLDKSKTMDSAKRKAFQEELEYLNKTIANYESVATDELKAAAQTVLNKQREWTLAANNLLMKEGLLDNDTINELRASGLWGENGELYVPLFREKDLSKINEFKISRIHKNMVENPYHYVAGAEDDFLDPMAATRLYMRRFADAKSRQEVAKAYVSLKGAKSELLFDGETTGYVSKVSKDAMKISNANFKSAATDMAKQIRASKFTDEFLDRAASKYKLNGAQRAADSAERSLATTLGQEASEMKFTSTAYKQAIAGVEDVKSSQVVLTMSAIDDDVAGELWEKGLTYTAAPGVTPVVPSVKDYVVGNYSSLPKNTRSLIAERVNLQNELKASSFLSHATKTDVDDIVYLKTGHATLEEALSAENFDSMTNSQKKAMLKKLFGKEKGDEIWQSATEYAHGTPAQKTIAGVDSEIVRGAEEEQALENELDRVRYLRAHRNKKMSDADKELLAKWKGVREKNFPQVTTDARKALDRAESAYKTATEAAELPDVSAINARNEELLKTLKADADEEAKLAREVRRVKGLRADSSAKLTKEDSELLKKWMGKDLPDVSMTARAKYIRARDLGTGLEEMPTGEGAFLPEVQTEAVEGAELTVKNAQKQVNSESVRMALSSDEYGNVQDGGTLGYQRQLIANQYASEMSGGRATNLSETWDEIVDFDPDFERTVQRSILAFDPRFKDLDEAQTITKDFIYNSRLAKAQFRLSEASENLDIIAKEFGTNAETVDVALNRIKDEYIEKILERPVVNKNLIAICEYHGIDEEWGREYFALMGSMSNKADFRKAMKKEFEGLLVEKGFNDHSMIKRTAGAMANEVVNRLQSQYDEWRVLMQEIAPDLVDQKGLYAEVRHLSGQISEAMKDTNNVVAIQNNLGQTELIETDPLVASFLNHENLPKEMTAWGRLNYLLSKTFRLGTTGINITSMVNQTFRDFGNAFIGGNFYRMWSTCANQMREVLGDDVIGFIERSDPELAKSVRATAAELGTDVNDEALKAIRRSGAALSPQVTETEIYRRASEASTDLRIDRMGRGVDGMTERSFTRMSRGINKADDVLGRPNEFREGALRTGVYNNAFADAVKRGYSYENAKTFATFAMDNATTNFGRLTEHFSNLQQTVPFLGAAINGTKSFWRLVSVDPVGVMGRLIGGIAIPTMAFTAFSLQDEESRRIYRNIKEYEKDSNMIFVLNGQIMSIPIPQEVSSVIAPFRRLVEYAYEGNPHTFWQIATNDIIGLSPINLEGFMNVDANMLTNGTSTHNFFVDNVEPGIAKLFSQIAPVPMKFAMMGMTGIDPYTMKKIDTGRRGIDPDTGEEIILNDYSSQLGQFVASLFKDTPFAMSGAMADKLLGSIIGTAPVSYTGWLIELGQGVIGYNGSDLGSAASSVGEQFFNKLTSPTSVNQYRSASESAWKDAVSQLYEQRQKLLTGAAWQDYMKQKRNAKTVEELEKLKAVRENLVADYYNDIKTVVNNLQSKYGADFTAEKYASVIALSTLYVSGIDGTAWGDMQSEGAYKDAKRRAVETMTNMGFNSPRDYSAFGYIRTNSAGDTYMAYSTPMSILDVKNDIANATNIHIANIDSILETKGITTYSDGYQDMQKAVSAIYAKDKLTSADFDKINKLYKEWDVKVMQALWPYIEEYGIEAITGDSRIIDKLDDVIKVPSDYEVTNKGRYISKSDRLNKQRGFAGSYIKYIYNKMKGVK